MKPIKLPKEQRELITENIRAYFEAERGETIGHLAADNLLEFFLNELGPAVYNGALVTAGHWPHSACRRWRKISTLWSGKSVRAEAYTLRRRGGSRMFNYVIDEELKLKLLMPEHARHMYALVERSRHRLRQWLPWVDGVAEQAHLTTFIKNAVKQGSDNGGFTAGLWVREELAGIIGYHEIDWHNRSVGIGYWLGEGYEGNGYMTSACRVFVDYALLELELNRVEIRCATGNTASRAIPERLGFIFEGVIREAEKLPAGYVNHAVYGLLRSEWKLLG